MRDDDFERTMDAWAHHEASSAPQLRPTAEMYRMVEARRRPSLLSILLSRRAMLATAVASVMVLAIVYRGLIYPSIFPPQPPAQLVAYVGLREGFTYEKGVTIVGPAVPPRRGPKKRADLIEELLFEFQMPGSPYVIQADVRAELDEIIALTSADNYRLALEPARDAFVYVFQLTSAEALVKLFPNKTYHSAQNPLQQGEMVHLPLEPNWFYLNEEKGVERLYIAASSQPLRNVEALYARYSKASSESKQQEALASLLEGLETIEQTHPDEAVGWVYAFYHLE
jgi:hypothetical protein